MAPRSGRRVLTSALCLASLALAGCRDDGPGPARRADLRDVVAVTSGPAALLAPELFPGVEVDPVIPAGVHPGEWRPSDAELDRLLSARTVLILGVQEFEPWTQRTALPASRVKRVLGDGIALLEVGTVTHTHGNGAAHSHGGQVATAWSDPQRLLAMGPDRGSDVLEAGAEGLKATLFALERAAALAGRALIVTDHGLEYVAEAAGLELRIAMLECGESGPTSPKGLHQLASFAKRKDDSGLLICLVEADVERARASAEEVGLTPFFFDLGATYDPERDSLDRLLGSLERLIELLSQIK